MIRRTASLLGASLLLATVPLSFAESVQTDPQTGLAMGTDWELVRNNCIACHSAKLITQQRGSAAQWLTMIRWMQAKQNLWQFEPDTENKIIAYLAENYPPKTDRRRAALSPDLMPQNPYAAETVNIPPIK
jgi:mono/diheme cytochrome c family protein